VSARIELIGAQKLGLHGEKGRGLRQDGGDLNKKGGEGRDKGEGKLVSYIKGQ